MPTFYLCLLFMLMPLAQAQPSFTQNASVTPLGELSLSIHLLTSVLMLFFLLLVLIGFALLESGLNRKGSINNTLMKSFIGFGIAVGCYAFLLSWFATLGQPEWLHSWFSNGGFGSGGFSNGGLQNSWGDIGLNYAYQSNDSLSTSSLSTTFTLVSLPSIIQALMLAIMLAILSAATSGRLKVASFSVLAVGMVVAVYPLAQYVLESSLLWGNNDILRTFFNPASFSSSAHTNVHLIAGFAALGAVLSLGARSGRYGQAKKLLVGHNPTMAALGGWFIATGLAMVMLLKFVTISVIAIDNANVTFPLANITMMVTHIFVAGSLSLLAAWFTMLLLHRRLDTSLSINAFIASMIVVPLFRLDMTLWHVALIGIGTGIVTILLIRLLDILGIDDPVGVISVHGILSALAISIIPPLFPPLSSVITDTTTTGLSTLPDIAPRVANQAIGVSLMAMAALVSTFILSMIIKGIMGLRMTPEREERGLDFYE